MGATWRVEAIPPDHGADLRPRHPLLRWRLLCAGDSSARSRPPALGFLRWQFLCEEPAGFFALATPLRGAGRQRWLLEAPAQARRAENPIERFVVIGMGYLRNVLFIIGDANGCDPLR